MEELKKLQNLYIERIADIEKELSVNRENLKTINVVQEDHLYKSKLVTFNGIDDMVLVVRKLEYIRIIKEIEEILQ